MLLKHAQDRLTESLMSTLRRRTSIDVQLNVTADYSANRLGLTYPHEQTYNDLLTWVLLYMQLGFDSGKIVYPTLEIYCPLSRATATWRRALCLRVLQYPQAFSNQPGKPSLTGRKSNLMTFAYRSIVKSHWLCLVTAW